MSISGLYYRYGNMNDSDIRNHLENIFIVNKSGDFSFRDFLIYIGVNNKYVCWDDGYNYEPTNRQAQFLNEERKRAIKESRKDKLEQIKTDK